MTDLHQHASATIAQGSKSFAAAAQLFAPETRRSAVLLYTWCRHCDDVIDGQVLGQPGVSGIPALAQLNLLRQHTAQVYAWQTPEHPAFAALAEVVRRHAIPSREAYAHLDGFAMDVAGRRYQTLDDTLDYCYHVAGVVGLMMARVMGVDDRATLDRACDLGLAFQLTNIARDIVDDARAGRCYLPQEWLVAERLTPDMIEHPEARPALARLASRLVQTAEPYYHSARAGLPALPLRSAWAVATAHQVYRGIGVRVTQAGASAWDRRQSTGRGAKLRLASLGAWWALCSRGQRFEARPAQLWQRPG